MSPNAILQSNILDIIFENRNKNYGAYNLRKYYINRLSIAILTTIGLVTIFSLCHILTKPQKSVLILPKVFDTPDLVLREFREKPKNMLTSTKQSDKKPVKRVTENMVPRITNEANINKTIAAIEPPAASDLVIPGNEGLGLDENIGFGNGGENQNGVNGGMADPIPPEKPKSSKPVVLNFAEVMPQYPGGLKALLTFLKRNLNAPDELKEGELISVKIRFVVNYNGKLESFNVVESGGTIFDNEVLRVLRKMPQWIPGKSNGENVSVYYTVPVKFTSEF